MWMPAAVTLLARPVWGCDLCAISSANSARGESASGFVFTLAEQFIHYDDEYLNGEEFERREGPDTPDWLHKSITHLVPTYNFSERVGVSLNVPIIYEEFKRSTVRFGGNPPVRPETEEGSEFGLGDMSLVGRVTLFSRSEMEWAVSVNALAGVKFPTGDTERLEDEVDQVGEYNKLVGPGHFHDVLGVQGSGVHQSHLTLGSGSFDGIFGLSVSARWQRWFLSVLSQYYLRTEGESGYTYGDEIMVNGGPGVYLLLERRYTLSLQAYAGYESMARAELFGEKSNSTGMTAWYLGPQVGFTWGTRFSAVVALDLPLAIENNGFQNVPDYRVHGGLTWRF
jgi:hypothetical protein